MPLHWSLWMSMLTGSPEVTTVIVSRDEVAGTDVGTGWGSAVGDTPFADTVGVGSGMATVRVGWATAGAEVGAGVAVAALPQATAITMINPTKIGVHRGIP